MTHFQLENVFLQRILKKEFFAISISVRPIDVVSTIDTIVSHLFKKNLPSRKKNFRIVRKDKNQKEG